MTDDLLLTAAQMRAWERAAIDSGAVTGLELMERAGRGAVDAILAEWPELAATPGRAVVLCGPGNNGGDGFVVARLLAGLGWAVEVFLYGDVGELPPDARVNFERWREVGEVLPLTAATFESPGPFDRPYRLLIDAIFGIGLKRVIDLPLAGMGSPTSEDGVPGRIVALDLPSGMCSDSGRRLGSPMQAVDANLTLAFGYAKVGHYLADADGSCGALRTVELGISRTLWRRVLGRPYDPVTRRKADYSATVRLMNGEEIRPGFSSAMGRLDKAWSGNAAHKYDHGHALILTGGFGRTGAARLSARAALRIGAGLVTVATPGAAMMECAAQLTAIMLRRCDGADALAVLLEDDRLNALCLGPGLGTDDRAAGLVATALDSGRSCLLDADALTLISRDDTLRAKLHGECVLTPHAGEFARLFPDIAARLAAPAETGPAYSKVDATRDAAARSGCVVLHKGPDTVIADPSGRAAISAAVYDRAAPWLATAGAGDVLSGMIAGLLARGLSPFDAACSGAWLHVEAALDFGPGLIAEDLPDRLPAVFRRLTAR